jgi:hypothetical protein
MKKIYPRFACAFSYGTAAALALLFCENVRFGAALASLIVILGVLMWDSLDEI